MNPKDVSQAWVERINAQTSARMIHGSDDLGIDAPGESQVSVPSALAPSAHLLDAHAVQLLIAFDQNPPGTVNGRAGILAQERVPPPVVEDKETGEGQAPDEPPSGESCLQKVKRRILEVIREFPSGTLGLGELGAKIVALQKLRSELLAQLRHGDLDEATFGLAAKVLAIMLRSLMQEEIDRAGEQPPSEGETEKPTETSPDKPPPADDKGGSVFGSTTTSNKDGPNDTKVPLNIGKKGTKWDTGKYILWLSEPRNIVKVRGQPVFGEGDWILYEGPPWTPKKEGKYTVRYTAGGATYVLEGTGGVDATFINATGYPGVLAPGPFTHETGIRPRETP